MPSVMTRYILRRWTVPLLGALVFYGALLLASEVVAISKEIFTQGAAMRWLIPLLFTALPWILGMVLPMAAVLGGLMGTQQMMEGSELVAAQGLGAGRRTWLHPWTILASILFVLATLNAHLLVPAASQLQQHLKTRMAEEAKSRFLRPGGPPWFPPGSPDSAFWVSPEGQVHIMESTPQGVQHLTAASMTYAIETGSDGSSGLQLRLDGLNGALYQPPSPGSHSQGSVIHLHQAQQVFRFALPSGTRLLAPTPLREESTPNLIRLSRAPLGAGQDPAVWKGTRLQADMELCRRITLPIASAALLLLGIGLGFGHPRFYKGGAILRSMGMIMLYYLSMRYFENMWIGEKFKTPIPLLVVPFPFLAWGWLLLRQRLRPHHPSRLGRRLKPWLAPLRARVLPALQWGLANQARLKRWLHGKGTRHGILRHWSTLGWYRNWASAMGTLLLLNFLVEYASLAGDLSKNKIHFYVFIKYWLWNLPPFLAIALPMAFLLGSLLALSEGALSREWLALRAGGVSLVRWLWSSRFAWAGVTAFTLLLQAWIAPMATGRANRLYKEILKRSDNVSTTRPWMYLGSTGVLWNLQGEQRWGFPLKAPGEAPLLLGWRMGDTYSQALAWGGLHMVQGPPAEQLFPERSLRNTASAEEASTYDLFHWQRWAPDPERAYMLWSRILGWLAGPCLVLAMLSYAFPGPRQGRGQALGAGLVAGLLFLGLQALFGGAAKASEIPATWGVLAPLLLLLSVSLLRLRQLRT